MDAILMFLVSNLTPALLEWLKTKAWFPFMARWAPVANRITPLVVAALVASGVTYQFHDGTLSISGLVPDQMLRGLLLAIGGAITQHVNYRLFVNKT